MQADYKKITQALNWLAKQEGGTINKMKAIKLIWMADRLHLREYGRPMTNDDYVAMRFGPVGSVTRNITDEATPYLSDEQFGYSKKYIKKTADNFFESINDVDASVFSPSEDEVLKKVYQDFGSLDQFQLFKLTHEFPEWKRFEKGLESKEINQAPMSYSDFFKNPEETSKPLNAESALARAFFSQAPEQLNASEQAFAEMQEVQGLWS